MPSPSAPLRITVYDKAFARKGFIGSPISVELHPRHNALPTGTITIAADHPYTAALLAPGCRLVVDYDGQQLMSGPVRASSGTSGPDSTISLQLEDDWRLLTRILGWPNPTAPISSQGATTAYDTKTGPAETVVKHFVQRASTRLGLPVSVAPDQGRGQTITVQMRMHALADRLLPLIDQAGVGVTVRQVGSGLVLDCYEPAWYPRDLTEKSGAVTAWDWETKGPQVTRTVVGGQGEGTSREFLIRPATPSVLEAEWGDVIETFVDARDADVLADLQARGDAALAEGVPTTGLKLTLAETETFRYGRSVRVGDLVTTRLVPGQDPITDVLREAVLKWDNDNGFTVTPMVGDRTDDPSRVLARAVAALGRAIRTDRAGR